MRALRVVLYTPHPIILPIAYNELVQGLLYGCWRKRYPELHDEGLLGTRSFRPFTYSRLQGTCSIDRKERTIRFQDVLSFVVRSPLEELIDELAAQLASRSTVRLGAYELLLTNLESRDRLLFPQRTRISFETPVVAYRRLEDGHTEYFQPGTDEWVELVQANTARKTEALGLTCSTLLQVIPLTETMHKQVTRFKGTYVTGWTGDMIVAADPHLMAALWCLGMGSKNSQGFGMFNITERPL